MNSQKELNKRTLSFGANSVFITISVVAIIGLLNFLGQQYPKKADLTRNKIHTFSDQSEKVMKSLKEDLSATFYGDFSAKERFRPIFDNYKKLSTKFKYEAVDPTKEPTRAKAAGIKKMDTLVLSYMGKTAKVEEITEEKVTNEIIKLSKDVRWTVCMVTGHGEAAISDTTANGLAAAKKGLEDQSYSVKELVLSQEAKVPADCTSVVMIGVSKAVFKEEIKVLNDYLLDGGRLVVGMDATITNNDPTQEFKTFLRSWGVDVKPGLSIDPRSRIPSVVILADFNKESPIVKDLKVQGFFPFSRPLELTNPAPEGLKTTWLAKTAPQAWGEQDMAAIAKGQAGFNVGKDLQGPLNEAVSVSGKRKDSKATRDTRIVIFGSSQFANNQFSQGGSNLDFLLNGISWTLEDESMISIRSKEDDVGIVMISENQVVATFWIAVIIAPLGIAILGIIIWRRRKKL
jgi:ABC-type uncharacterized transport system involved in gliding motility auxiliary subunit